MRFILRLIRFTAPLFWHKYFVCQKNNSIACHADKSINTKSTALISLAAKDILVHKYMPQAYLTISINKYILK